MADIANIGNTDVQLTVEVRGEEGLRRINRNLDKSARSIDGMSRRMGGLNSAFSIARNHLGTIATLASTAFGAGFAIRAADSMERYKIQLRGVLHDMRAVEKVQRDLSKLAATTPFRFEEVFGGSVGLFSTAAADVDTIVRRMRLAGDLSAQFGLDLQSTIGNIIRVGGGGIGAADLFRERGILSALGLSGDFGLKGEQILSKLFDAVEEKFSGATEQLATTFSGRLSTFNDALFQLGVAFAEQTPLLDTTKGALETMTDWVNKATESLKELAGAEQTAAEIRAGDPSAFDKVGAARDIYVDVMNAAGEGISGFFSRIFTISPSAIDANFPGGRRIGRGTPFGVDVDTSAEIGFDARAEARKEARAVAAEENIDDIFQGVTQYYSTTGKLITSLEKQTEAADAFTQATKAVVREEENWASNLERLDSVLRQQFVAAETDRQKKLGKSEEDARKIAQGAYQSPLDAIRAGTLDQLLGGYSDITQQQLQGPITDLIQGEGAFLDSLKAKREQAGRGALGLDALEGEARTAARALDEFGKSELDVLKMRREFIEQDAARELEIFKELHKTAEGTDLYLEGIANIEAKKDRGIALLNKELDVMRKELTFIEGFDPANVTRQLERTAAAIRIARDPTAAESRGLYDQELAAVDDQIGALLKDRGGITDEIALQNIDKELDRLHLLADQYKTLADIANDHPLRDFWQSVAENNAPHLEAFVESMNTASRYMTDQEPLLRAIVTSGEDTSAVYQSISDSGKLMSESIKAGESSLTDAFNNMKLVLADRVANLLIDVGTGLALAAPIAAVGGPGAASAFLQLWFGSAASLFGDLGGQKGMNQAIANDAARFAAGGYVSGPGTPTSDSIPALLSDGEFVVNARSASRYRTILEMMNQNRFQAGGAVGRRQGYDVERNAAILGSGVNVNIQNNLGVEANARVSRDITDRGEVVNVVLDSLHGGVADRTVKQRYGLRNRPR